MFAHHIHSPMDCPHTSTYARVLAKLGIAAMSMVPFKFRVKVNSSRMLTISLASPILLFVSNNTEHGEFFYTLDATKEEIVLNSILIVSNPTHHVACLGINVNVSRNHS
jgi:uncharacterized protein YqjF (DUF2071 family)